MKKQFTKKIAVMSGYVIMGAFLQCVFISLLLADNTFAQRQSLNDVQINLHVQGSVLHVFKAIEEETDFHFSLNHVRIREDKEISLKVKNESLKEVLEKLSREFDLEFMRINQSIHVSALKKRNHRVSERISWQQSIRVTGKVTSSEDASGIPGVNILIKGTSVGAVSGIDGSYAISVPDENAILVFSSIGFVTEEIAVGNQSVINVSLTPDIRSLNEVVVIGYGTQERKDVTGSISSVSAEELEKVPVSTLDEALQGRAAGVQVTNNDGAPGGSVSVRIRGIGSIGNNSPLYVVDGYPVSGNISNLNPNDIETVDILKDASATAIYGSRAANGVVIITTKRGSKEGLEVSFDALWSLQSRPETYEVLSAQQFATLVNDVSEYDNTFTPLPEWSDPNALTNIDWQDEIYQRGSRQNYNLTLRGGNEKLQSAFSLGYYDQKGVVKKSTYTRYNANLNIDYKATDWFDAAASIKYARTEGNIGFGSGVDGVGLLTTLIPTMTGNPETSLVKDEEGNYGYYTKGRDILSESTNVLANLEEQDAVNHTNNLLASGYVEFTILEGLTAKSNFGINVIDYSGYYFTPSHERTTPTTQAFYSQTANNTFEWVWENYANYTKTFGIHSIDFLAGISAQKSNFRRLGIEGTGAVNNDIRSVSNIVSLGQTYGDQEAWSLASQFGRLTYKLQDKYILTGTIRRDGSSRFGEGEKYGVFPSVALAWRAGDETFIKNLNVVSDLKLRGSWGQTGNQNIPVLHGYSAKYTVGSSNIDNRGYVFGRNKTYYDGIALAQIPNPDLTWETTTQLNIGINAGFFDNRLILSADYYNKESEDFLLDIPVPAQTGFTSAPKNVGSIRNKGFEFNAEYRDYSKAFKWSVGANLATVDNEVLSFTEGYESISYAPDLNLADFGGNTWIVFSQTRIGGEVGAFYGFKTDGIFQSQAEIDALDQNAAEENAPGTYYQSSTTAPGDRKFMDINDDGRITDDDRTIIGSPIPDFYGGVNMTASYRGFDFSMFWYASVGNEILNFQKRNLESFSTDGGVGLQNISEEYYLNRWTEDNPSNVYPRATSEDPNGNTRVSDAYVEDGSYLRLRNLQIGYTLPAPFLESIGVDRFRVYLSAQNLFTITNYSGLDPEVGEVADVETGERSVQASGLDIGNFPNSRNFTLGVNLQF